MYSKAEIFSLTLSMLLLEKEISNPETDTSREARTLRKFYNLALKQVLADLNLDGTASDIPLELLYSFTYPNNHDHWQFAYKYPSKCAFFRRVVSGVVKDNRYTKIDHAVKMYLGQKVIFTTEEAARGEYIPNDVNLDSLNAFGGMALAARLGTLCSTLVVGKGAAALRKELAQSYVLYKAEAQEQDKLENEMLEDPWTESEFVAVRTS